MNGFNSIGGTVAADGKFVLEGSVDAPVICEIHLETGEIGQSIELMVENADYTDIDPAEVSEFLAEKLK